MKKDITICIGTVGSPTFKKSYSVAKKIANSDTRIKKIVVIKNKYPTSKWLNEMRRSSETTWTLQLDEDMYLYDNSIDKLIKLAQRKEAKGIKILNASGMLFDLFLKTNIGSLKLWNTAAFGHGVFKNVLGSDRQFAKDLSEIGFFNVATKDILGDHDSAPNIEIAYFKYKEYIEKIIRFQGVSSANRYIFNLKKIYINRRDNISKFAYAGGVEGLRRAGKSNSFKTKDKRNNTLTNSIIKKVNNGIKF